MDQPEKTFTPEGPASHNWIGRIIVAVILGEALWSLIVSVMNNLVVPWLGDVMGQSSQLPTSFTQRPYNYPDLFVSVVELCIAGIVAAILNHFFQASKAGRVKPVKSVRATPAEPTRVVPPTVVAVVEPPPTQPARIPPLLTPASPPAPRESAAKANPVASSAPVAAAPPAQVPLVASPPKPFAVASSAPPLTDSVAKPLPPATRAEPAKLESPKPKKSKQVYYNIVGEPVSSDED